MTDQPATQPDAVVSDVVDYLAAPERLANVLHPPDLDRELSPADMRLTRRGLADTPVPGVDRIVAELRAAGVLDEPVLPEAAAPAVRGPPPATATVESLDRETLARLIRDAVASLASVAPNADAIARAPQQPPPARDDRSPR